MHVAEGVLFCGGYDVPERTVDVFCEKQQDDQGKDDQDDQKHVGDIEHAVGICPYTFHGQVDHDISADFEITGDRCNDTEHIIFEGIKKSPCRVIVAGSDRGIEIFYKCLLFGIRRLFGIDDHPAGRIEDPDFRVHVGGQRLHLCLYFLQGNFGFIELQGIGV